MQRNLMSQKLSRKNIHKNWQLIDFNFPVKVLFVLCPTQYTNSLYCFFLATRGCKKFSSQSACKTVRFPITWWSIYCTIWRSTIWYYCHDECDYLWHGNAGQFWKFLPRCGCFRNLTNTQKILYKMFVCYWQILFWWKTCLNTHPFHYSVTPLVSQKYGECDYSWKCPSKFQMETQIDWYCCGQWSNYMDKFVRTGTSAL